MKTYKLHFIRHGMTSGNLEGKYIGHLDIPVCEEGIAQLESMTQDYTYPHADVVLSSPLRRCLETAQIIYPGCKPAVIDDLIEYDFGDFEGRTADEMKDNKVFVKWISGGADAAPPFGESNNDFGQRITGAVSKIIDGMMKTDIREAAVVTHGGVIMGVLSSMGLPQHSMPEWMVPNGCGFTVLVTPTLWTHAHKFEVFDEIPLADTDSGPDGETDEEQ